MYRLRFVAVSRFHASHVRKKTRHNTSGSAWGGVRRAWRGRAETGTAGHRRFARPRCAPSLLLPRQANTIVVNDIAESRTSEILCKRTDEQNPRLTTGGQPDDNWIIIHSITRTDRAVRSCLLTIEPSPFFCLCKLCKICLGNLSHAKLVEPKTFTYCDRSGRSELEADRIVPPLDTHFL